MYGYETAPPEDGLKYYYDALYQEYGDNRDIVEHTNGCSPLSIQAMIDYVYFERDGKAFMKKTYCPSTSFTFSPAHKVESRVIDSISADMLSAWEELGSVRG